jgi:hypothetical protein
VPFKMFSSMSYIRIHILLGQMEIEPYLKCGFGSRKFRISPKAKKYGRNIVFKDKKTS